METARGHVRLPFKWLPEENAPYAAVPSDDKRMNETVRIKGKCYKSTFHFLTLSPFLALNL